MLLAHSLHDKKSKLRLHFIYHLYSKWRPKEIPIQTAYWKKDSIHFGRPCKFVYSFTLKPTVCNSLVVVIWISLKVDMPILTCIYFTLNWLTLTSEMHFVKFHPEVASCLLSRGKRKYAPLGMRLLWKYIRNYFLVYQLISHFLLYLQNYKEFQAEILDLQSEKYGLSFDIKKYTTSGWALGDENVIGIRAFKGLFMLALLLLFFFKSCHTAFTAQYLRCDCIVASHYMAVKFILTFEMG